jgi:chemotaxis response regulator CheB
MGRDGAEGLKALKDAGHYTIAQDEASSAVYGMPKAAVELDAASEILPLNQIGPRIAAFVAGKK